MGYLPWRPLDFPPAGGGVTYPSYSDKPTGGTHTVYQDAVGNKGLVRNIGIIVQTYGSHATAPAASTGPLFNVYYDGESTPSVSVPLMDLFAMRHGTAVIGSTAFSMPFFGITQPTDMGGTTHFGGILRYPMPYQNGLTITITHPATYGATWWTNAHAENALAATPSASLRWLASTSSQAVGIMVDSGKTITIVGNQATLSGSAFVAQHVGYVMDSFDATLLGEVEILQVATARHATIDTKYTTGTTITASAFTFGTSHTFLTRPAGEQGWVVATFPSWSTGQNADFTYLEGNVRFRVNQETTVSQEWTGTEDFLLGAFYFHDAQKMDWLGGISCYGATKSSITGARLFVDDPIRYTNGIAGAWPCLYGGVGSVTTTWTTVFYKQV